MSESIDGLSIDEMAEVVKDAVRTDKLHRIEGLPREALIQAAWHGIAVYTMDQHINGDTLATRQYELEKDARLALLSDEEQQKAYEIASKWLTEHSDL